MAEQHILCCTCDACLNGSGGLRIPGAGAVFKVRARRAELPPTPELREPDTFLAFSPELTEARSE